MGKVCFAVRRLVPVFLTLVLLQSGCLTGFLIKSWDNDNLPFPLIASPNGPKIPDEALEDPFQTFNIQVQFNAFPTPAEGPQEVNVHYPMNPVPEGIVSLIYFVSENAFDCDVSCNPLDYPNVFSSSNSQLLNNPYSYSYGVTEAMVGDSFSFFVAAIGDYNGELHVGVSSFHTVFPSPDIEINVDNPIVFVSAPKGISSYHGTWAIMGHHTNRLTGPSGSNEKGVFMGGGLHMLMPNGDVRDLTIEAGYGVLSGYQGGDDAIAVRDPTISFDGTKILFSMLIGNDAGRIWQIYEMSNFIPGSSGPPVVTKVPNQPATNNISPAYLSNPNKIAFLSDRPKNPNNLANPYLSHLYPIMDEYEHEPTTRGVEIMNRQTGFLELADESPSGALGVFLDTFGRIIYTRWDHLERLQDVTVESFAPRIHADEFSTNFNNATPANTPYEYIFPEKSISSYWDHDTDAWGGNWDGTAHRDHHFVPWEMHQDGTEVQTLGHVGRHELQSYLAASSSFDDVGLAPHSSAEQPPGFDISVNHLTQIFEDQENPGWYFLTHVHEDGWTQSHQAGQIVRIYAPDGLNPDDMLLQRVTVGNYEDTGYYRDTIRLRDNRIVSSFSPANGSFDFSIYSLAQTGSLYEAAVNLVPGGVVRNISHNTWSHNGKMHLFQPREVTPRPIPPETTEQIPEIEMGVFASANVNPTDFKQWLRNNDLALVVSRNITRRDDVDRQQAINLKVAGSSTQTTGTNGNVVALSDFQFIQAEALLQFDPDNVTPYSGHEGRQQIGKPMRDPAAVAANPPNSIDGAVEVASDGSIAAFVPSETAMSWQSITTTPDLSDPVLGYTPVVRERKWVTFKAGEVRVCAACHGINKFDQAGNLGVPTNPPQALRDLLIRWKNDLPACVNPDGCN